MREFSNLYNGWFLLYKRWGSRGRVMGKRKWIEITKWAWRGPGQGVKFSPFEKGNGFEGAHIELVVVIWLGGKYSLWRRESVGGRGGLALKNEKRVRGYLKSSCRNHKSIRQIFLLTKVLITITNYNKNKQKFYMFFLSFFLHSLISQGHHCDL